MAVKRLKKVVPEIIEVGFQRFVGFSAKISGGFARSGWIFLAPETTNPQGFWFEVLFLGSWSLVLGLNGFCLDSGTS